jgi:hypothetical protein
MSIQLVGPYGLSSFLSVAMGRAFGTAMSGRSKGRQELADLSIPLNANLTVGYHVAAEKHPLDEKFAEWGEGPLSVINFLFLHREAGPVRTWNGAGEGLCSSPPAF